MHWDRQTEDVIKKSQEDQNFGWISSASPEIMKAWNVQS